MAGGDIGDVLWWVSWVQTSKDCRSSHLVVIGLVISLRDDGIVSLMELAVSSYSCGEMGGFLAWPYFGVSWLDGYFCCK